jgi:2-polyprenyl-3-methyl-5-hydroxy-6-metoxy-1,4-benzoquinol methylase
MSSNPTEKELKDIQSHWDTVYQTKASNAVSWFQSDARLSLQLISNFIKDKSTPIIDIGCGTSILIRQLLDSGYDNLAALDISSAAIASHRASLGNEASKISWHCSDLLSATLNFQVGLWHDRAVFHFLTNEQQQTLYKSQLLSAVQVGAYVMIATFAPTGPTQCSNLPIQQHDQSSMLQLFGSNFELVETQQETHITPWQSEQLFNYFVLRRHL